MTKLRAFFSSMTGRVFVILLAGMMTAAIAAATIALRINDQRFEQEQMKRIVDHVQFFVTLLDATPLAQRPALFDSVEPHIRNQPQPVPTQQIDRQFQDMLNQRGGMLATAVVHKVDLEVCIPLFKPSIREGRLKFWETDDIKRTMESIGYSEPFGGADTRLFLPACWLVTTALRDATPLRLSIDSPWITQERSSLFDPTFLGLLTLAAGILAYVVARFATAPIHRLSANAIELGQNIERTPMQISGPTEVQHAAIAFNAMQQRLRQHIRERTQMLASITHDLQTPLTRLRLRLERVDDEVLRERLLADLSAMQELVDEGLELARSAEISESCVMLDLDSLLESLIEDVADAGGAVTFEERCHAVLPLRPLSVKRLFSNLIDNAIKYGRSAKVSATHINDSITVRIVDQGPGLPEDMLERVFDPFVRVDASRSRQTGGVGLGLTIARMLAEKNGAKLLLRNHPDGGLEAITRWDNIAPEGNASRR